MSQVTRDLAKLPKWAQQRIETLERNAAHLSARLEAGEDSNTIADPFLNRQPLGDGETIRFVIERRPAVNGSGMYDHAYFDARIREDGILQVSADRRLRIFPHGSNMIHLERF